MLSDEKKGMTKNSPRFKFDILLSPEHGRSTDSSVDVQVKCGSCQKVFNSASKLLTHFAEHFKLFSRASPTLQTESDNSTDCDCDLPEKSKEVNVEVKEDKPDVKVEEKNSHPPEENTDYFNPLTYCVITMEDNEVEGQEKKLTKIPSGKASGRKKYACHLCPKVFGWSTDLKRHILSHTGERPFRCVKCNAAFTRNFLLQKHLTKIHPCTKSFEENFLLEKEVEDNLSSLKKQMEEMNKSKSVDNRRLIKFDGC